jgi:bifunctional N-acetylglucosamine-1-phosphate-uridyltransferase/glucosamine-1-phosphate-acetyltransferase GlmU-like protein
MATYPILLSQLVAQLTALSSPLSDVLHLLADSMLVEQIINTANQQWLQKILLLLVYEP